MGTSLLHLAGTLYSYSGSLDLWTLYHVWVPLINNFSIWGIPGLLLHLGGDFGIVTFTMLREIQEKNHWHVVEVCYCKTLCGFSFPVNFQLVAYINNDLSFSLNAKLVGCNLLNSSAPDSKFQFCRLYRSPSLWYYFHSVK